MFKKKFYLYVWENACRSQIAHGLLNDLSSETFEVFSAAPHPSQVHPISIVVMEEIGIDILNILLIISMIILILVFIL
jgi:protein-tyrosine-phosphatase